MQWPWQRQRQCRCGALCAVADGSDDARIPLEEVISGGSSRAVGRRVLAHVLQLLREHDKLWQQDEQRETAGEQQGKVSG